jgi:hypothetical protein
MKKIISASIFFVIAAALIILGINFLNTKDFSDCRNFFSGEDCWLCQNGEWVRHGSPYAPQPTTPCKGEKAQTSEIVVDSPLTNEFMTSPWVVEGRAKGPWFFEAIFPVRLLNGEGEEIARTSAQAQSDWQTSTFVPFKAEIEFDRVTTATGTLILEKSNSSGLVENDLKIEIPVHLDVTALKIEIYFNNNELDPQALCDKVFPVEREIPKTEYVVRAALEELLKGPTGAEKSEGFFTAINPDVKIQKLVIENGVVKVDFSDQLEFEVGGSCRVTAIRSQIIETLKQFSSAEEVVISINGRTEDVLQP